VLSSDVHRPVSAGGVPSMQRDSVASEGTSRVPPVCRPARCTSGVQLRPAQLDSLAVFGLQAGAKSRVCSRFPGRIEPPVDGGTSKRVLSV